MVALIPTKKIPQLTAYGVPLAGTEMLEISVTGTSRRITTRDFVLPIDSVLTTTPLGVPGSNSRQLTLGIGLTAVDGGPGSTYELNATGAVAGPANPTALVGLVAVNGAAVTYMRSDAAPALDQGIIPIWTATHTFSSPSAAALLSSASPNLDWNETDAAVNNRRWRWGVQGEQLLGQVVNDANNATSNWVVVDRTLNVVDIINLLATTVQVNGQNVRDAAILTSGTVATARLGSGVADATTWLRGDQSWQVLPGGFTGFANPTTSIGLAIVNGVATTAMRSDAAPALSQAIVPTWTGRHIFAAEAIDAQASLAIAANRPELDINENDAAADNRRWNAAAVSEQLRFRVLNDAGTTATNWLLVDRTGTTVDAIQFLSGKMTVGDSTFTPTGMGGGNVNLIIGATVQPNLYFYENDAAADEKVWRFVTSGGDLFGFTRTDVDGAGATWLSVTRTGTVIDILTLGAATLRFDTTTATTVGAAGGATALPALPTGYLSVNINGTAQKIPYYAN